jgi:hypothetical protein
MALSNVGEGPLEETGIGVNRWEDLGDVDDHSGSDRSETVDRPVEDIIDPRRSQGDPHRTSVEAAHVQQVVNQIGQPIRLGVDRLGEAAGLVGRPLDVPGQQTGRGGLDARQRSS